MYSLLRRRISTEITESATGSYGHISELNPWVFQNDLHVLQNAFEYTQTIMYLLICRYLKYFFHRTYIYYSLILSWGYRTTISDLLTFEMQNKRKNKISRMGKLLKYIENYTCISEIFSPNALEYRIYLHSAESFSSHLSAVHIISESEY